MVRQEADLMFFLNSAVLIEFVGIKHEDITCKLCSKEKGQESSWLIMAFSDNWEICGSGRNSLQTVQDSH